MLSGHSGIVGHLITRITAQWQAWLYVACVVLLSWRIALHYNEQRRLRNTGGTSGKVRPHWWPFGIDLVVRSAIGALRHQNREVWEDVFRAANRATVEFRIAGHRIIFTQDPENIKAVLATQFADFGKGHIFHTEWKEFLGDSIFTTDGALWHDSRQLIRPQFVKDRVSDLHIFENHLQTFFTAMSVGGDAAATAAALASGARPSADGVRLDISDLFFRYTLDVATDFLLGKDVQSLTIPGQEFAEAFNRVQQVQGLISRTGPFNFLLPRGSYRRNLQVIDGFVNQFIEHALQLPLSELEKKSSATESYTFLHELARFTRDRTVLRDQVVAVLLAGRDTTAATLSWAIYELGRHPECVARLRAEIQSTVGVAVPGQTETTETLRHPTYADLKAMKYLQNVLSEVTRMYPAVPYNVRLSLRDTTLPRGGGADGTQPMAVLGGTRIGYSTLTMHRRADLYPAVAADGTPLAGPDTFSPERWAHWQPKPWQYIPFNGGPRICIGQQFALTEMGYVLVRLFQKFARVESYMDAVDGGNPTLKSDIVLMPADGVHVAFFEATE